MNGWSFYRQTNSNRALKGANSTCQRACHFYQ